MWHQALGQATHKRSEYCFAKCRSKSAYFMCVERYKNLQVMTNYLDFVTWLDSNFLFKYLHFILFWFFLNVFVPSIIPDFLTILLFWDKKVCFNTGQARSYYNHTQEGQIRKNCSFHATCSKVIYKVLSYTYLFSDITNCYLYCGRSRY